MIVIGAEATPFAVAITVYVPSSLPVNVAPATDVAERAVAVTSTSPLAADHVAVVGRPPSYAAVSATVPPTSIVVPFGAAIVTTKFSSFPRYLAALDEAEPAKKNNSLPATLSPLTWKFSNEPVLFWSI